MQYFINGKLEKSSPVDDSDDEFLESSVEDGETEVYHISSTVV